MFYSFNFESSITSTFSVTGLLSPAERNGLVKLRGKKSLAIMGIEIPLR